MNIYDASNPKVGATTDKVAHGYLPRYDTHLGPLQNRLGVPGVLLEIGVAEGASLRMWARWLEGFDIVGIDIALQHGMVGDLDGAPNMHLVHANFRDVHATAWGLLDVVIDDGSHQPDDQLAAFDMFWPHIKPGGWYVIEDLLTMWGEGWGGSEDLPNGTISLLILQLVNTLQRRRDIVEFHAYDEIVFMRKKV